MKKRELHFLSLLFIITCMAVQTATAQSSPPCSTFIRQKDTTICPGIPVTLDLLDPPKKDSLLPGVWKLLIKNIPADSTLFNIKPFGFNTDSQYLYSIIHKKIIKFDLKNNSRTEIIATNWPGDYTEFTYDFTNKRLLCWRGGRDSVYAVPQNGGSWTGIGGGAIDRQSNGSSVYWNPIVRQVGLYGGYGFNQAKSWIYENNGTAWVEKKTNPLIDSTPPKGGNIVAANADGKKLYLFSGQGNYSGDELTGACTLGSPWATASGMYCWLRDLWELDLSTYKFTNILPVNNQSILYEGALTYYYDKSRFYLFGGYQPTGDYTTNQNLANTNRTFIYRRGIDSGFIEFFGEGDVPPPMPKTTTNNYSYYDPVGKRMIWARYDGIWAYYPDTTLVPPTFKSFVWSTGDTTSSITVKPMKTTVYRVTRTLGSNICKDSITITVNNMQTALQRNLNVCGDTTILDAGAGFSSYLWNTGATTQTIVTKLNGTYVVTVARGICTLNDTSKVQFATPVNVFTVGVQKDTICARETDSLFVVTPQAGITYAWYEPGNSTAVNTGSYLLAKNITKDIIYTITASSTLPVCAPKSVNARVLVRPKLPAPVVSTDPPGTATVVFRWDPVPGAVGYLISQDSGVTYTTSSSGYLGLTHTITGLQPNQAKKLWVKAMGLYACQASDSTRASIKTLNPFGNGVYVPNAFTPNGDGVNDVFLVYGTAIASVRLMIYNQWGGQLFISTDISKGWDGNYKGEKSPAGIYIYALEAIMEDGKRVTKSGSFKLIR